MTRFSDPFISSTAQLCEFCNLPINEAPYDLDLSPSYPCLVPRSYAEKIKKKDWFDPLLLQVLPRADEATDAPCGYSNDPVGDTVSCIKQGILHKYPGRILLITTPKCTIRCRFCFRREHCVEALPPDGSLDTTAAAYIRTTPEISEVILSGGDPLTLTTHRLHKLTASFSSIKHLATIRIHTRVPIVSPESITSAHLECIKSVAQKKQCIVIIHCNHPQELCDDNGFIIRTLRNQGVLLFNQTVLLKGINDSAGIQKELVDKLLALGVVPYYLHQLDRVTGAHHFEVPVEQGTALVNELRNSHPGYAVPRYVREVAGEKSKQIIC